VVAFLVARFLVGAALLWPLARRRPRTPLEARHGMAAGSALLVGFVFQTVGLRDTTSATSAFITYLLVVMVPLIAVVRYRRLPTPNVVFGVALAVTGLFLLSGGIDGIGRGELLTVVGAFCFALHIVVLGEVARHHDPVRLTFWQVLTVGVACLVPGALSPGGFSFDGGAWAAAAFTGFGATAVAFWCMSWAQRVVPESQAAIILLLEPVSAGVLGVLAGEALGVVGAAGAGLILVAVLVSELGGRSRPAALGAEIALVDGIDGTGQPPPS
jgi:drug/metabolite transporter (DMT)-like permease